MWGRVEGFPAREAENELQPRSRGRLGLQTRPCRSQWCCLPEGCLLCCPVPLMFWRAVAGCCCVHWILPLAFFPAHRSFVCWKEKQKKQNRRVALSHYHITSLQERRRGLILICGRLRWFKNLIFQTRVSFQGRKLADTNVCHKCRHIAIKQWQ